ncbi:hypothetical protein AYI69_g2208 [Smittium culicis]|uniref:Uncharacterized protein n=1 Tax=Smittium culicis TaxID=133412 RepID=A0A1R1Y3B0_9FUNG|nr:hypothetical protein AYI69_g5907 [Smittium culicis]OMJ28317.1 hypothetical protein AYI69_g2208 [Smittium culicis]
MNSTDGLHDVNIFASLEVQTRLFISSSFIEPDSTDCAEIFPRESNDNISDFCAENSNIVCRSNILCSMKALNCVIKDSHPQTK